MDIGERIKLRRKELKLSADVVAEKLASLLFKPVFRAFLFYCHFSGLLCWLITTVVVIYKYRKRYERMIKMLNEKEIKELIESGAVLYFTSEQGKEADKNAFESMKHVTDFENPVLKELGNYDGESFEFNDYEVVDGDTVYTLEESD